jgi:hypothetical protein
MQVDHIWATSKFILTYLFCLDAFALALNVISLIYVPIRGQLVTGIYLLFFSLYTSTAAICIELKYIEIHVCMQDFFCWAKLNQRMISSPHPHIWKWFYIHIALIMNPTRPYIHSPLLALHIVFLCTMLHTLYSGVCRTFCPLGFILFFISINCKSDDLMYLSA